MRQSQMSQPALVKSITDDDDSNEDPMSRYAVLHHDGKEDVDARALAYLLRYETMVRQQEAEDMATLAHVRPLLERIERLGHHPQDTAPSFSFNDSHLMEKEVSYKVLERALDALESSSEVMTTDKQLMMVLRTLTEKVPTPDEAISWAEFLQCYKTVVSGMQTLQHLPSSSESRSRARDRTLSILSLFEPPSSKLLAENIPSTIEPQDRLLSIADSPNEGLLGKGQRTKKVIKRAFAMSAILVTLLLVAFFLAPELQSAIETYKRHERATLAQKASRPSRTRARSSGDHSVRPQAGQPRVVDTLYRRNSMAHSRPNYERFGRPTSTELHQQSAMRPFEKPDPTIRHSVKHSVMLSALVGGVVGVALAPVVPQVWSATVPKLVSGLSAGLPAKAGTNIVAAAGAVSVSSLAISALIRKGFGFIMFHLFKAPRGNSQENGRIKL